mmetsp:Transcript_60057/g.159627  ORF Transcript_60057/g.159627 Transcript_60057/m.159627 type:complete len:328 (+) Transcript_60057:2402-3385(+)
MHFIFVVFRRPHIDKHLPTTAGSVAGASLPMVDALLQAGQACAQTVTGSFPSGGTYPYSSELSRTQRTFSIRVPNPVVDFTSPTPADGSQQVFVSGCSFGSLRLFVEGSSEGRAADYNASMASVNSTSQRVTLKGHYNFEVSADASTPPPSGVQLVLTAISTRPDDSVSLQYEVSWSPGLTAPATLGCFLAYDTPFRIKTVRRCFRFARDRCRYCLGPNEGLESLGRRFGVDWLQVYMANPTLRNPDAVPPYTLVNLGVSYQVRAGDTPAALARRFAADEAQLRSLNDYLLTGTGDAAYFAAGDLICVLPRACDRPCLGHGSSCNVF